MPATACTAQPCRQHHHSEGDGKRKQTSKNQQNLRKWLLNTVFACVYESGRCVWGWAKQRAHQLELQTSVKMCIDSLEGIFTAVINIRYATPQGQEQQLQLNVLPACGPRRKGVKERESVCVWVCVCVCLSGRLEDFRTEAVRPICCGLWPICSFFFANTHSEAVNHQEEANFNYIIISVRLPFNGQTNVGQSKSQSQLSFHWLGRCRKTEEGQLTPSRSCPQLWSECLSDPYAVSQTDPST